MELRPRRLICYGFNSTNRLAGYRAVFPHPRLNGYLRLRCGDLLRNGRGHAHCCHQCHKYLFAKQSTVP